jgi:hypothetical protein
MEVRHGLMVRTSQKPQAQKNLMLILNQARDFMQPLIHLLIRVEIFGSLMQQTLPTHLVIPGLLEVAALIL